MDLSLSGLASGFDWKSMISQLADVERAPENTLAKEQSTLQSRNSALSNIQSFLSQLQTSVDTLNDTSLYDSRTASSSDASKATASASAGAAMGTYTFKMSQLATAASFKGATDVGAHLNSSNDVSGVTLSTAGFASPVTAGNFTVNGKQVTIATSDSLQAVFTKISDATSGAVTAAYDHDTDKITLTGTGNIVLGSATDTSNFLQVTKLNNNGGTSVTSSSKLGAVKSTGTLSQANFATPLTADTDGKGQFTINGVTIDYDVNNDSVANVLARINNSSAGVTAGYDYVNNRFSLTNKSTGDVGIAMEDVSGKGNFLTATGLAAGTLTRGTDLKYSINDGPDLYNHSNTLTEASSGITGLSVTALTEGSTVNITVGSDTSKIKTAINNFVTLYNRTQSYINSQTASTTDSTGKVTAGLLANDSDAVDINKRLRSLITSDVSGMTGVLARLDSLGFSTNGKDDALATDSTDLDDALNNHLSDLKDFFTHSTTGFAARMQTYLKGVVGDDGSLITHEANISKQIAGITTQISDIEKQVTTHSDQLTAQFVAMETAQAKINQQMSFLQQQISKGSL